jgi:hypothetical protein
MHTYRLTPVRIDAPEWDYSLRHEPVQVVAGSEAEARELATLRYVIGAGSAGANLAGKSPWSSATLVRAQLLDRPDPAIPLIDANGLSLRDKRP